VGAVLRALAPAVVVALIAETVVATAFAIAATIAVAVLPVFEVTPVGEHRHDQFCCLF
jgi:hypothetical protein